MIKQIQFLIKIALVFLCPVLVHAQDVEPDEMRDVPLQFESLPNETINQTLPKDFLMQLHRDTTAQDLHTSNAPDRSLRTVWLRMFPLLRVPMGDPYGETTNKNQLHVENANQFDVFSLDNGNWLGRTKSLDFDFSKSSFKINGQGVALQNLWLVPAAVELTTLSWDKGHTTSIGVQLRGQFVVKPTNYTVDDAKGNGTHQETHWSIINVVSLDDYIRSVVPSETLVGWHLETFKAQAIAARSYGLYSIGGARAQGREYDIEPTTLYQSYRGVQFRSHHSKSWSAVENPAASQAVNQTQNQVMTYGGQIIKAFFSANSGGVTCLVSECFQLADLPYIQQINDAPGIQDKAGGTWGSHASITSKTVAKALKSVGTSFKGTFAGLAPLATGPSGRTWTLKVTLKNAQDVDLNSQQSGATMQTFGPIRSHFYTLGALDKKGHQTIVGHGYGHGVGMSQWGAQIFALQGWDAYRILSYYYRNIQITTVN